MPTNNYFRLDAPGRRPQCYPFDDRDEVSIRRALYEARDEQASLTKIARTESRLLVFRRVTMHANSVLDALPVVVNGTRGAHLPSAPTTTHRPATWSRDDGRIADLIGMVNGWSPASKIALLSDTQALQAERWAVSVYARRLGLSVPLVPMPEQLR